MLVALFALWQRPLVSYAVDYNSTFVDGDLALQLEEAWLEAKSDNKNVLLVFGTESCDRCALLNRYLDSNDNLMQGLHQRFVVLHVEVQEEITVSGNEHLPAVVVAPVTDDFNDLMRKEELLTFVPQQTQTIYSWVESVLAYTESNIQDAAATAQR